VLFNNGNKMEKTLEGIESALDNIAENIGSMRDTDSTFGNTTPESLYQIELQMGFLNDKIAIAVDHLEDIANALKIIANK
jgi:hypothetical protein